MFVAAAEKGQQGAGAAAGGRASDQTTLSFGQRSLLET
jgi:hypothetical protein